MNEKPSISRSEEAESEKAQGPNLILIYSLLGLAFVAALAIAAFIVLPFYRHR